MRLAGLLLVAGLMLGTVVTQVSAASPATSPAASPTPPAPVVSPVDPRSEGEGPGIVGSPLVIAGAVVLLGVATAAGTALLLRLTRDD